MANITIARMGFPRMAFSACFGGPLLSKFSFCCPLLFLLYLATCIWKRHLFLPNSSFCVIENRYAAGSRHQWDVYDGEDWYPNPIGAISNAVCVDHWGACDLADGDGGCAPEWICDESYLGLVPTCDVHDVYDH